MIQHIPSFRTSLCILSIFTHPQPRRTATAIDRKTRELLLTRHSFQGLEYEIVAPGFLVQVPCRTYNWRSDSLTPCHLSPRCQGTETVRRGMCLRMARFSLDMISAPSVIGMNYEDRITESLNECFYESTQKAHQALADSTSNQLASKLLDTKSPLWNLPSKSIYLYNVYNILQLLI